MKTVTITSQGQITIPAKVRQAWGIKGSEELQAHFNSETQRLTLEKPLTVDGFLKLADKITAKIPKGIKPLSADKIHSFYANSRTKDIVEKQKPQEKKS